MFFSITFLFVFFREVDNYSWYAQTCYLVLYIHSYCTKRCDDDNDDRIALF